MKLLPGNALIISSLGSYGDIGEIEPLNSIKHGLQPK
jgi:hypothetical protein